MLKYTKKPVIRAIKDAKNTVHTTLITIKLLKGPIDFHLQNPCYSYPVKSVRLLFFLYSTSMHRDNNINLVMVTITDIAIKTKD